MYPYLPTEMRQQHADGGQHSTGYTLGQLHEEGSKTPCAIGIQGQVLGILAAQLPGGRGKGLLSFVVLLQALPSTHPHVGMVIERAQQRGYLLRTYTNSFQSHSLDSKLIPHVCCTYMWYMLDDYLQAR